MRPPRVDDEPRVGAKYLLRAEQLFVRANNFLVTEFPLDVGIPQAVQSFHRLCSLFASHCTGRRAIFAAPSDRGQCGKEGVVWRGVVFSKCIPLRKWWCFSKAVRGWEGYGRERVGYQWKKMAHVKTHGSLPLLIIGVQQEGLNDKYQRRSVS